MTPWWYEDAAKLKPKNLGKSDTIKKNQQPMHQKVQGWENILSSCLQSLLQFREAQVANRCILDKLRLQITPSNSIFTKKKSGVQQQTYYTQKLHFSRSKDEKEVAFQDMLKMEQIWRLQQICLWWLGRTKTLFYDDVLKSLLFLGYDAGYRHKLRKPEKMVSLWLQGSIRHHIEFWEGSKMRSDATSLLLQTTFLWRKWKIVYSSIRRDEKSATTTTYSHLLIKMDPF